MLVRESQTSPGPLPSGGDIVKIESLYNNNVYLCVAHHGSPLRYTVLHTYPTVDPHVKLQPGETFNHFSVKVLAIYKDAIIELGAPLT